jgi:hypothetical protein
MADTVVEEKAVDAPVVAPAPEASSATIDSVAVEATISDEGCEKEGEGETGSGDKMSDETIKDESEKNKAMLKTTRQESRDSKTNRKYDASQLAETDDPNEIRNQVFIFSPLPTNGKYGLD